MDVVEDDDDDGGAGGGEFLRVCVLCARCFPGFLYYLIEIPQCLGLMKGSVSLFFRPLECVITPDFIQRFATASCFLKALQTHTPRRYTPGRYTPGRYTPPHF